MGIKAPDMSQKVAFNTSRGNHCLFLQKSSISNQIKTTLT